VFRNPELAYPMKAGSRSLGHVLCLVSFLYTGPHSVSSAKAELFIRADASPPSILIKMFAAEYMDGSKTGEAAEPSCPTSVDQVRFDFALPHVATHLSREHALKIVAIGSSSTFGVGASSPSASYPSRLELELARRLPESEVTLLNLGVSGEEASQMVARFSKM
jgi:hypothetical protein